MNATTKCSRLYSIGIALTLFFSYASAEAGVGVWSDIANPGGKLLLRVAIDTAASPEVIYAGVEQRGVYSTADGGNTWTALPTTGLVSFSGYNQIYVDPATHTVYLAASLGLFRFNGTSWQLAVANDQRSGSQVAVVGSVIYLLSTDGFYKYDATVDAKFVPFPDNTVFIGNAPTTFAVDTTSAAAPIFYVIATDHNIYSYQTGGTTTQWNVFTTTASFGGGMPNAIAVDPAGGNGPIYVCTSTGLFNNLTKNNNGVWVNPSTFACTHLGIGKNSSVFADRNSVPGAIFQFTSAQAALASSTKVGDATNYSSAFNDFVVDPISSTIYLSNNLSVFSNTSPSQTSTWVDMSNPSGSKPTLPLSPISAMVFDPRPLTATPPARAAIIAQSQADTKIRTSADGGGTWNIFSDAGAPTTIPKKFVVDPNATSGKGVYMITGVDQYVYFWSGVTWTTDPSFTNAHVLDITIDTKGTQSTLYASTQSDNAIYQSVRTASGSCVNTPCWKSTGGTTTHPNPALAFDVATGVIYAGDSVQGVIKSADGGATWLPFDTGLAGFHDTTTKLAIDVSATPHTLYALNSAGLQAISTVGVNTAWQNVNPSGTVTDFFIDQATTPTNTIYAVNKSGNLYWKQGGNWSLFAPPLLAATNHTFIMAVSPDSIPTILLSTNDANSSYRLQAYTFGGVPSISAVAPNTGPISGGTAVKITGSGFTPDTQVTIGGVRLPIITFMNSGEVDVTTEAVASAGAADVVVNNYRGNANTSSGGFTFTAVTPPTAATVATYPKTNSPPGSPKQSGCNSTNHQMPSNSVAIIFMLFCAWCVRRKKTNLQ